MSLLMFDLAPELVVVMTDTLATTPAGEPYKFASKCVVMPHLGMAVAHTGVALLGTQWCTLVQNEFVCRDIEMLNQHAAKILADIWSNLDLGDSGHPTATVYHLGRSEASGQYAGYAYRSINGFVSENLEYGFRIKPAPKFEFDAPNDLPEWIDLAVKTREEQDRQEDDDCVRIGGALNLTVLQDGAFAIREVYRFRDFEQTWEDMIALLARSQQ